jgi:hypothetical protein
MLLTKEKREATINPGATGSLVREAISVGEPRADGRPLYEATATRNGRWWVVSVPSLGIATKVRSLSNAADQVKFLVALWTECQADSFDVTINAEPPR